MTNFNEIRNDFPILQQKINGKPLVYFDNAATTQKPKVVLDALMDFYTTYNSNVHRGVHSMSNRATTQFESTRTAIQRFINAKHAEEIIFTHGTTEAINLVSFSFARKILQENDEIIITELDHHANIVP